MSHPLDSLILELLGSQSAPIAAHEIAQQLGMPSEDIRARLTMLIAGKQARRHHYQDGVLRYTSLVTRKPESVRPTAKGAAEAEMKVEARQVHKKGAPLQDKVLDVLRRANGGLTVHGIHASLYGELSFIQIGNLLQLLRQRGLVVSPGNGNRTAGWRLANEADLGEANAEPASKLGTEDVPQPAAETAAPARTTEPSQPVSLPQLQRLVQQAQSATANALEAMATAPLSPALLKLAAANSLLVEASTIVHHGSAV